jgi:recombination protein RecA
MAGKKVVAEEKTPSSLDVARKAIQKKYGDVITTMGEKSDAPPPTISTGSLGLDSALGCGGFVKGRVYEVYGHPSGGKTTLTMSIIAQAQRRGMTCCFVDAERAADPKLFKAMGVDINKLIVVEAFTGDENLDVLESLIRTGEIDVAVVDSVSALIPKAEATADMEDQFMGLLARLMSKAMRKFVPLAGETDTLLIFINQVRNKIGAYGDPETTTGGLALDFSATGRIKVSGGESKSSRIEDMTGEVVGHHTSFLIKKNKFGKPYRKATVPLIYGVGYDTYWECLTLALDLGILERAGAWYKYNGNNIGQGELNALAFLRENEIVFNEIRDCIIIALGLNAYYEQNS